LVTGGNGFIGSHLVELLVDGGALVIATASRPETRTRFLQQVLDRIEVRVGDLSDLGHARRCMAGADILMCLAARVGGIEYNLRHPGSIFRDNLSPFLSVIEAARLEGTPRVLVTSSACVYPRLCAIPTPEEEGFRDRPEPTNEGYGWAKRMQEFVAEAYAREFGMNFCIARPYNAYGPRDNFAPESSHVIPALIRRVEAGEDPLVVWGDGTGTRSFLYVTDFARGLMLVAEKSPQVGAINIGARDETSVRELAETIVELSGRSVRIEFDARKPAGQPRRCCDTSLAERLLGFRATVSLREGLARTIAWYRTAKERA
jgi:GDP-L-fucose synthase